MMKIEDHSIMKRREEKLSQIAYIQEETSIARVLLKLASIFIIIYT